MTASAGMGGHRGASLLTCSGSEYCPSHQSRTSGSKVVAASATVSAQNLTAGRLVGCRAVVYGSDCFAEAFTVRVLLCCPPPRLSASSSTTLTEIFSAAHFHGDPYGLSDVRCKVRRVMKEEILRTDQLYRTSWSYYFCVLRPL
jgi:hypothetical protein